MFTASSRVFLFNLPNSPIVQKLRCIFGLGYLVYKAL